MALNWPTETALPEDRIQSWCEPGSNRVLDFHGDPLKAKLVVFSDGNHHMALQEAMKAFYDYNPDVVDIFYATTPPYPIVKLLQKGAVRLGNLTLSVRPHVFISPPDIIERLKSAGFIQADVLLAQNQGSVLLIPRGNPKKIQSVQDLMRADVRLFISNPETEKTSYNGYRQTLESLAECQGIDVEAFCDAVFGDKAVFGERIHHREAPEAVADGSADVAIVYYHLALRYTRILPDLFDIIPLGGTKEEPVPPPENLTAQIHMGLIGDGGKWGKKFIKFMRSDVVAQIYGYHGLIPKSS